MNDKKRCSVNSEMLDRMYKNKLKEDDLEGFSPEQIKEMKAICKERREYFEEIYAIINTIGC